MMHLFILVIRLTDESNRIIMNNSTNSAFNVFFLVLIWCTISCSDLDIQPTECNDGKCSYLLHKDMQLIIWSDSVVNHVSVESGEQWVFEYTFVANDNPNIADDEFTENLYFEIDPELSSFSYSDEDLRDMNAVYQQICHCTFPHVFRINKGTINGEKLNKNAWYIEIDVEVEIGDNNFRLVKVSQIFEVE